jgi:hypothetical protein
MDEQLSHAFISHAFIITELELHFVICLIKIKLIFKLLASHSISFMCPTDGFISVCIECMFWDFCGRVVKVVDFNLLVPRRISPRTLNYFMRESYPASLWNAIGSIPLAVLV